MKDVVKRVLRASAGKLRKWSAEPPALETGLSPLDFFAAPFTQNPLFFSIMREHPHTYVWPAVQAARLAKHLGLDRTSFIEFGVAGGNSLLILEKVAKKLEDHFKVHIDVYGFDTGKGMPKPEDYRDMPNLWSEGFYRMDVEALKQRLTKAQLVLGPVAETVPSFLQTNPAPVSFISFDLDYYSSTVQAFALLEAAERFLLPRVQCYFDDILGYTFCEFNGEQLAITDFNAAHPFRKIALIPGIRYYVSPRYANAHWEKYYMLHLFDHSLYGNNDGTMQSQMPLR